MALTSSVAVCHPMANFDCSQQYFKRTTMIHDLKRYLFHKVSIIRATIPFKSWPKYLSTQIGPSKKFLNLFSLSIREAKDKIAKRLSASFVG